MADEKLNGPVKRAVLAPLREQIDAALADGSKDEFASLNLSRDQWEDLATAVAGALQE